MSFSLDISKFVKHANGNMEQLVRKVCIDLSTKIVRKTPRDTGRARANWFATINSKAQGTTTETDYEGNRTVSRAASEAERLKPGDTYYLVNNLPYIERLEDGYSERQAPNGMVKTSVVEYTDIVNKVAKSLK